MPPRVRYSTSLGDLRENDLDKITAQTGRPLMSEYKELDRKVITLAKQVVKMCTEAGSGHPSSALSLLHLTAALMYRVIFLN